MATSDATIWAQFVEPRSTAHKRVGINSLLVLVRDETYPHLAVRFTFECMEGGELPLREIDVDSERSRPEMSPPPISNHQLRAEFRWASWERAAREAAVHYMWKNRGQPSEDEQSVSAPLGKNLLHEVAAEYRANVKAGVRNPAGLIAERHGVSPGTARSWIHRARKQQLLGPAADRAAGDVATPEVSVESVES